MKYHKLASLTEKFLQGVPSDHGWPHACAVWMNAAVALWNQEELDVDQRELVLLAAVLHDVDDRKFFQTVNYANARQLLTEAGYNRADQQGVIEMIALVSTSVNGNSAVADRWKLIPRDSDRVEALGLTGIQRCYEYTRAQNCPVALASTPRVTNMEELAAVDVPSRFQRYVEKGRHSPSMIDHFYDKLLAIGTMESRNAYLQGIADERMQAMREWLFAWCRAHPEGDVTDLTQEERVFIGKP